MRRPALSLLAVVLSTACGPQDAAPGPGSQVDLETLNIELSRMSGPITDPSHFAPLCDAMGYPLVGNIVSKTGPNPSHSASSFCAELRAGRK
jgi:hypothetical protein